jgi:hypothetical protein
MDRYMIRLRTRRPNKQQYAVAEIWRLSDDTKVYEEWSRPYGEGPNEAERLRRLLEAVPDEQADAVIKAEELERQRQAINRLPPLDEFGAE